MFYIRLAEWLYTISLRSYGKPAPTPFYFGGVWGGAVWVKHFQMFYKPCFTACFVVELQYFHQCNTKYLDCSIIVNHWVIAFKTEMMPPHSIIFGKFALYICVVWMVKMCCVYITVIYPLAHTTLFDQLVYEPLNNKWDMIQHQPKPYYIRMI